MGKAAVVDGARGASRARDILLRPNLVEADDVSLTLCELTEGDIMFLTQGILNGIDWEHRWSILQHLHANDGRITFDDLVRLGVYQEGICQQVGGVVLGA